MPGTAGISDDERCRPVAGGFDESGRGPRCRRTLGWGVGSGPGRLRRGRSPSARWWWWGGWRRLGVVALGLVAWATEDLTVPGGGGAGSAPRDDVVGCEPAASSGDAPSNRPPDSWAPGPRAERHTRHIETTRARSSARIATTHRRRSRPAKAMPDMRVWGGRSAAITERCRRAEVGWSPSRCCRDSACRYPRVRASHAPGIVVRCGAPPVS